MEKTDPHKTHSYSHDYMLMTAFDFELRNNLALNPKYDNVREIIEGYMNERVKEIKDRWK
jgi:hypothetical protein